MTIQSISESTDTLTLRHFPLLAWSFIAVASYGLSTIVAALLQGRQPLHGGTIVALTLLGGITLAAALIGGSMTTARFDRRAGTVQLRRYGLLGRRGEERPLADVVGLQVRVLRRAQHRVELQMRSGERLPLTEHYIVTIGNRGITRLARYLGLAPELVTEQIGRGPGSWPPPR